MMPLLFFAPPLYAVNTYQYMVSPMAVVTIPPRHTICRADTLTPPLRLSMILLYAAMPTLLPLLRQRATVISRAKIHYIFTRIIF